MQKIYKLLILKFLFLLVTTNLVQAQTIRFVTTTGAGNKNGLSWANASDDLQLMINNSANGDEIFMETGVYKPARTLTTITGAPNSGDRDNTLVINKKVKIYGGFDPDNGISDLTHSRIFSNISAPSLPVTGTTLSGDLNGDDVTTGIGSTLNIANTNDNTSHIITASGDMTGVVLDGLNFKGGEGGSASGDITKGAAILLDAGSPVINLCRFTQNMQISGFGQGILHVKNGGAVISNTSFDHNIGFTGGAVYTTGSSTSVQFNNCLFYGNRGYQGGGIFNHSANVSMANCIFDKNYAGVGGGIYSQTNSVTSVNQSVFSNNESQYGAGINVFSAELNITACQFNNNNGFASSSYGAAVYINNSKAIIVSSTFNLNETFTDGGAVYISDGGSATPPASVFSQCTFTSNKSVYGGACSSGGNIPITYTNCSFKGNEAVADGGAVVILFGSSTEFVNCLFSGNKANGDGGAIFNGFEINGSTSIINCTFAGNVAAAPSAPVHYHNTIGGNVINSIIYGNSNHFGVVATGDVEGVMPDITYSLVQGYGFTTNGNIDSAIDPLFTAPQPAAAAPSVAGDYSLQTTSPVINKGNNASVPAGVVTDLAGNTRITGLVVEMGAYESISALPVIFGSLSAVRKNGIIYFNWSTETEVNNSHYEIEISLNGKNFRKAGTVLSKAPGGNSQGVLQYAFQLPVTSIATFSLLFVALLASIPFTRKKRIWFSTLLVLLVSVAIYSCKKSELTTTMADGEKVYARILQVDKDGAKEYSKVFMIVNE